MKDFLNIEKVTKSDIIDWVMENTGLDETIANQVYDHYLVLANKNNERTMLMVQEYFQHGNDMKILRNDEVIDTLNKNIDTLAQGAAVGNTPAQNIINAAMLMTIREALVYQNPEISLGITAAMLNTKDPIKENIQIAGSYDVNYIYETYMDVTEAQSDTENEIGFYKDVRELLSEQFKSYATEPGIRDTYQRLMLYLEDKTNELQNSVNVQHNNMIASMEFFQTILRGQANASMFNAEAVRLVNPDLQTMLYDIVYIINSLIVQLHSSVYDFIDSEYHLNYVDAHRSLVSSINSSEKSSYFNTDIDPCCSYGLNNLPRYQAEKVIMDCLMIIKGIQNEFNISIRKLINIYFTYAIELTNNIQLTFHKLLNTNIRL